MHISVQKESTQDKTFSLWGKSNTGPSCLESLWSLHPWRYSKPGQTESWATCCIWPCFSRGIGLEDLKKPPSNLNHSVILWNITWRIIVFNDLKSVVGCGVPRILTGHTFRLPNVVLQPQQMAKHHIIAHSPSYPNLLGWGRELERIGSVKNNQTKPNKTRKWCKNHICLPPTNWWCPASHWAKAALANLPSTTSFITENNVIQYGTSLWSVGVSCPTSVPCQILVHPQPTHWWGNMKHKRPWRHVSTAQQ